MKILLSLILGITCCLLSTCGDFSGSYTDPKTGAVYSGSIHNPPQRTTSDAK